MTLAKSMEFIETPVKNVKTDSVKRIQNSAIRKQFKQMSDLRVLWLVLSHLGYKRRVGLLVFALVAYFTVDHMGGLYNFVQIVYGTMFG